MLKFAFEKAFTDDNIKTAFRKMRTWPMDKSELLFHPLPASSKNVGEVLNVEKLCILLKRKRSESKTKTLGADAELKSSGIIGIKGKMVLTSERAMHLIPAKDGQRLLSRLTAEADANRKAMKAGRREYKKACDGLAFWKARWEKQAANFGVSVDWQKARVRTLTVRGAHAKL